MSNIKKLSEDLIKKIAAGEVIERPASVVKELVENSIDALSTKIEIEVGRGGKFIKVSDNGTGINPVDIPLLFTRHATSKLKTFNDLFCIASLGFRGEALASISAVSKITCRSKHVDKDYGFEIKFIDGKCEKKTSAISIGTVFEVEDLFYNIPAREKFLKSETTEVNHIFDVVIACALSHSKISFKLSKDGNTLIQTSGSNNLKQVIAELLGEDLQNNLISISSKNNFLSISGFVSSLDIYRNDRKSIFIFVSSRPVKCHIVSKAIFSALENLLPAGKYPVVILNLDFKPGFVDINVHPAKKEVRYTNPTDVYNLVLHTIQEAISGYYKQRAPSPVPVEARSRPPIEQKRISDTYSEAAFDLYKKDETNDIKCSVETPFMASSQEINLFSTGNLNCEIIYSNKPTANITKIGNKSIFEVGTIFDNDVQIVFSGEITGDENYSKAFFNMLFELSEEVYKSWSGKKNPIQKQLVGADQCVCPPDADFFEDESKEKGRKKPSNEILYKVWERDNWTCVYCGKQLLDPEVVKEAMPKAKDAFITYINKEGNEVTTHVLREHTASYDHYLPASKLPQFNFDQENLFACCFGCNRKKSDSMELKTWKPERKNSWNKPLEIAGVWFESARFFKETSIV